MNYYKHLVALWVKLISLMHCYNPKLKKKYRHVAKLGIAFQRKKYLPTLEANYPKARNNLSNLLQKTSAIGQPLTISIVKPILQRMTKVIALKIIHNNPKQFKVTCEWSRQFLTHCMNWTFEVGNTTSSKLFMDWIMHEKCIAYRLYEIIVHSIKFIIQVEYAISKT